jgi:hypothetical protein
MRDGILFCFCFSGFLELKRSKMRILNQTASGRGAGWALMGHRGSIKYYHVDTKRYRQQRATSQAVPFEAARAISHQAGDTDQARVGTDHLADGKGERCN